MADILPNLIEYFYIASYILSVILTCAYAFMWHKHFSVNFSLMFTMIPIANLGYMVMYRAKTLEEVIVGLKISYLGGCFLILFITFYIFNMCKIKLSKWLIALMVYAAMGIYSCVLTVGNGTIFYKDISMVNEGGRVILEKSYGIMHTVFYMLLGIYFVVGFSVLIYSLLRKKDVSRRIIWLLFIPEAVCMACFFGSHSVHLGVDLVPAGYVFAQVMYLIIAHYICLYDISDMAIDSMIETGDTGFISFTLGMRYLGSNETAREIFLALNDLTIDQSIKKNDVLNEIFMPWIDDFRKDVKNDKHYYKKDEQVYLVDVNNLYYEGKVRGFQFVITDDTRNQKYIELLDNYNSNLEREVEERTEELIKLHNELVRSMAKLVESRDNSTGGHIIRTSDMVELLMEEIMKDPDFVNENNITEEFRDNLVKAAPLHDIGKISIDDDILRKPGKFTPEEYEIMKRHAPEGAKVLHSILKHTTDESFKVMAENVAHYHHERMDGSGYPEGLVGDEIPLEARIMALADVYDALVSKRVYKDKMSYEKADAIMMESMGKHFDKRLERFYVEARPRMEAYYDNVET